MTKIGGSFDLNVYPNKPSHEFLLTQSLFYLKFFTLCMMFRAGMNFKVRTDGKGLKMKFWYPDVNRLEVIHEKML